jgi:hypothetical protein
MEETEMTATKKARPLGITILSLIVMVQGVFGIVIGLNLMGVLNILDTPSIGAVEATGGAILIFGIVGVVMGIGLMSMKFWAYVIALGVLGLTVLSGALALIQFGFGSENLPSLVPAVISGILFAYMFSERVRPFYDPD